MIAFDTLWNNHPITLGMVQPCLNSTGQPLYENQCAIRMSVCLRRSGISLSGLQYTCEHGDALRVEEMITKLDSSGIFGIGKRWKEPKSISPLCGRRGIVAFRQIGTGLGHIDLWRGYRILHGSNSFAILAQEIVFWDIT